jgi:hypothetical protein
MSSLDPQLPPAGEDVHLPGPSLLPLLTTVGITMALVGVTVSLVLVIAGTLLTVVCIARWIADTRRDIDELPLDPH